MIAFVGSTDSLYILSKVRKESEYMNLSGEITGIQSLPEVLLQSEFSTYVIDLDYLIAEPQEILQTFQKLKEVSTAECIFFASGFSSSSTIVQGLRNIGFKRYITAETIGDMQQQLEDCLNGKDNAADLDKLERAKSIRLPEKEETGKPVSSKIYKTVGICGTQHRIGTTTMAIQLVKYFQYSGLKSCYIEANDHKHVLSIPTLYEVEQHDKGIGKIRFEDTDYFYDLLKISEVLSLPYDVYVYDFGVLSGDHIYSFLEKDCKILVGGTLSWELDGVHQAMELLDEKNIQYLFNFTPKSIRNELERYMRDKADSTYFSELIPNVFSLHLANKTIYESLFQKMNVQPTKPQKKRIIFKR